MRTFACLNAHQFQQCVAGADIILDSKLAKDQFYTAQFSAGSSCVYVHDHIVSFVALANVTVVHAF